MEKNYYDLITSMIKEHRKYPGCEDIIDDIAEHVYRQAKTVINSIEDENVIRTYLEKIVTTALITVPRKFCINIRNKKDENVIEEIINKTKNPEPAFFETEIKEKIHTEFQEEIADEHFEDNNLEEVAVIEPIEESIAEVNELETLNFNEPTALEDVPSEDTEEGNITDSLEATSLATENVDKTLVDKMINGLSNTDAEINITDETDEIEIPDMEENIEETESDLEELTTEDIITEDFDITVVDTDNTEEVIISDEIADTIEEIEDFETIETVENIEEDNNKDSIENNFEISEVENIDEEESTLNFEELTTKDIITEDFDITIIDTDDTEEVLISDEIADTIEGIEDFETIETVESIEEEEEEVIEADDSLQEEAQDLMADSFEIDNDNFDILSEDALTLEQEENSSDDFDIISLDDEYVIENIDIKSDDIVEEPQNTEENICDESSDAEALLKCFAFEPEENNYYLEDILASLKEADNKNPEKQLLKICELKFKQNLSVSAISEELDLSVTEIIERLNTIIDIVKD